MKIAYDKMSIVIEMFPDCVSSLVVENAPFLYQLLIDFKLVMEGEDSGIVVSIQDKPVSASKTMVLVTDFVEFTLNQKSLLAKVISELDKIAKNEIYYQESQKLLTSIENYILGLTLDFPCEISCEKLNIQNLLKGAGISIVDDYGNLEERILAYMDLVREFEEKELFVFVNLRCLVPPERLQLMIDTALTREYQILLIDNVEYPKLSKEKRIIIDEDFCEI